MVQTIKAYKHMETNPKSLQKQHGYKSTTHNEKTFANMKQNIKQKNIEHRPTC